MQSTTATFLILAAMACVLVIAKDYPNHKLAKHVIAMEDWQSHIKVVPIQKGDELVLEPVIAIDDLKQTFGIGYEWTYCDAINDCFATIVKYCLGYPPERWYCDSMDIRWTYFVEYNITYPKPDYEFFGLRIAATTENHTSILKNIVTLHQKKGLPKAYTSIYQINVLEMNDPIPQSMEITDMLGNPLSIVNGVINVREKDQLMIVCKGSKITCPRCSIAIKGCDICSVGVLGCYGCRWDSYPEFQVSIHIGQLRLSYDNWKFSLEEEYPTCEQTIEVEKSHQGNVLFCETNTGAGIGWRKITNSVTLNIADLPSTTPTRPTTTSTTKTIPSSPELQLQYQQLSQQQQKDKVGTKKTNDITLAVIIGVAGLVCVGVIIAVMYVRGKKKAAKNGAG